MSNRFSSGNPLYKQKGSLVARAIEEFNKVSNKQESNDMPQPQENNFRKGANPQKRRSVLGRGLSSLMSPTSAPVVEVKMPQSNAPIGQATAVPTIPAQSVASQSLSAQSVSVPSISEQATPVSSTQTNASSHETEKHPVIVRSLQNRVSSESQAKTSELHTKEASSENNNKEIELRADESSNSSTLASQIEVTEVSNGEASIVDSRGLETSALDSSVLENSVLESKKEPSQAVLTEGFLNVAIDRLIPNPDQPRREFSQKEIQELASSIRRSGLIQPILVRKSKKQALNTSLQEYQIVAGERRWRAAKEAGLISIPAVLKDLDDRDTLELGIIENVQRQDLNPIEEALAYQKLITEFGTQQEELAKIIGKDRSSISNTMRLLALPEVVQDMLKERKLSAGHGRAILSLDNPEEQVQLAKQLVEAKLSVREAEKRVSEKKNKSALSVASTPEESLLDSSLEERLRLALGTKVKVKMSPSGKGEVKISFFSKAEFEAFLEKVEE